MPFECQNVAFPAQQDIELIPQARQNLELKIKLKPLAFLPNKEYLAGAYSNMGRGGQSCHKLMRSCLHHHALLVQTRLTFITEGAEPQFTPGSNASEEKCRTAEYRTL